MQRPSTDATYLTRILVKLLLRPLPIVLQASRFSLGGRHQSWTKISSLDNHLIGSASISLGNATRPLCDDAIEAPPPPPRRQHRHTRRHSQYAGELAARKDPVTLLIQSRNGDPVWVWREPTDALQKETAVEVSSVRRAEIGPRSARDRPEISSAGLHVGEYLGASLGACLRSGCRRRASSPSPSTAQAFPPNGPSPQTRSRDAPSPSMCSC